MDPSWDIPPPPGQERRPSPPTKTGTVLFKIPGTGDLCETYYSLWGSLSSPVPPLICLHGGPGIIHDYLLPISLLSRDYAIPILMYDQVGCGKSTRFPTRKGDTAFWTPALFIAELANLIRALGITRYDLFGHSWGGMLAAQFVLSPSNSPGTLRKLILCGTPADMPTFSRVTASLRACLPPDLVTVMETAERSGRTDSPEYQAATIEFYRRHLCRAVPFAPELLSSFAAMAQDPTVYATMTGPTEFTVTGTLARWSVLGELEGLSAERVPGGLLLLNGCFDEAQDVCVQPFLEGARTNVKWVQFALSASMPWLEETERFLKVVGGWLTRGG
ncbi:Alpha/Beta hydrolase protein [Podospora aff. communis PSN243]|uniref:Alpha/Beta hydrolase protein n=1 Tax=Podospora aff. communis PSN243 TaxID=3040156 RepID=A0AAV9G945_9PEZI|nr:Alpha/Beta hydrolase protein [Podospora aff. communis PSN243]